MYNNKLNNSLISPLSLGGWGGAKFFFFRSLKPLWAAAVHTLMFIHSLASLKNLLLHSNPQIFTREWKKNKSDHKQSRELPVTQVWNGIWRILLIKCNFPKLYGDFNIVHRVFLAELQAELLKWINSYVFILKEVHVPLKFRSWQTKIDNIIYLKM